MWSERFLEKLLPHYRNQFPVTSLTGARQLGKTSLIRHLYPEMAYYTLDDPILASKAEKTPDDFFTVLRTPAIIDEAHYAPSMFRHIKLIVDKTPARGAFLLTGSQNFALMQNVSESLAGRCGILQLQPLSAAEVRQSKGSIDLDSYIATGGFPALHSGETDDVAYWFSSYIATYIERDVRNLLAVASIRDFSRFMRMLALRTGQVLSLSEIANDTGISPNTVKSWLSVLQASHQIYLLEPYYNNLGKRIIKSPKVYFCDTGLAMHLMGFSSWADAEKTPIAGSIWETYVFNQLYRHFVSHGIASPPIWFWRSQYGHEVDFIVELEGRALAIGSKMTGTPNADDGTNIGRLKKLYGDKLVRKAVIACRVREEYPLDGGMLAHNAIDTEDLFD